MNITTLNSRPHCRALVFAVLIVLLPPGARAVEPVSVETIKTTVTRANSERKTVILHFTGIGPWCTECPDLQTEVLKTPEFKKYAAPNFIILEIAVAADQDSPLAETYGVTGWPTLVLLDAGGDEIDKIVGYRKGDGPEAVIKDIERRRKRR